jgi:hypothetical protein
MSTPAILFGVYFGIGLVLMIVAVASQGKEKRTKDFELLVLAMDLTPVYWFSSHCCGQSGCSRCLERSRRSKRADPAGSANARERAVIRMGLLCSTSPVFQKDSLSARPRAAHL